MPIEAQAHAQILFQASFSCGSAYLKRDLGQCQETTQSRRIVFCTGPEVMSGSLLFSGSCKQADYLPSIASQKRALQRSSEQKQLLSVQQCQPFSVCRAAASTSCCGALPCDGEMLSQLGRLVHVVPQVSDPHLSRTKQTNVNNNLQAHGRFACS